MATDGDEPAGARSGITFGVTLEVPWNALEVYVHLHSDGVVGLDTVPDVLGLAGRRPEAAVVRVLQGRGVQNVRALIPDPRVLERGFHNATIVDMEDSAEPVVSEDDLSLLRLQWPVTVLWSMVWLQNELDAMRAAAKKRYRNSRPGDCLYCGKWIKYDMYRHVSWCRAHDVPSDIKSASLDNFVPPWTVRHQIWADTLKPCHSGVSTDVLLFSKISSRWCTTTGCSRGG